MKEITIDPDGPDAGLIHQAGKTVAAGGVVVFPTDTVYGIGAALFNEGAVERIYAIKGRAAAKGLIAMIGQVAEVESVCSSVPAVARTLIRNFWPGALTLILPAGEQVPELVTVEGTIGVRMPDSKIARALIRATGQPLATTSANLSGRPSAVDTDQAKVDLGELADLIIGGGPCPGGLESTVVDVSTAGAPVVIREGAIAGKDIKEALKHDG